jgi:hypothetical protein
MVTDQQLRDGLKAVVNDAAATLCHEIDAAPDRPALEEIAKRISGLPAMLTPAK